LTLSSSRDPTSLKVRLPTGQEQEIPVDTLILTAGPWTGKVAEEFLGESIAKKTMVTGARAHSIVVKPRIPLSAHAVFMDMTLRDGSAAIPELYSRPDGELLRRPWEVSRTRADDGSIVFLLLGTAYM
jgi:hypothetical protein